MDFLYRFWSLAGMAFEFAFVEPLSLMTLPMIISLAASTIFQKPFDRHSATRTFFLTTIQATIFVAMIILAMIAWVEPGAPQNRFGLYASYFLIFVSIGNCVFYVWTIRGRRWFAVTVALLTWWLFVAGAALLAGMSVSGRYL
jgi:hypothetical protein